MMHMSTHLFLAFPHLPAQIEDHLNPSAVARKPFLLLAAATAPATATTALQKENEADPSSQQQHHHHHNHHHHQNQHVVLLDVSPEAEAQGIDTSMTLSHITTHFPPPVVIQIPAATWATTAAATAGAPSSTLTSFSQSSLPPLLSRDVALAAYKEAAEKAPVRLLRKLVEGEGLVLLEEEHGEGDGNTTIGNYRVALSAQETSSSSQQEQQEQQGKDLGQYLSAELERLLGYQLIFEVVLSKGEVSDSSSSKRKRKEETTAEPTEGAEEEEEEEDALGDGAGAGEDEAPQAEEEVEVEVVEEYICEHCRAFFFDAAALVDHVEKTHLATNNATNHQQQPLLPPSTAAAATKTKTRPSSRGGNPLPPPPPPPPQVQGPGTHSFIEALTTLTDAKDIEAFLTRIGAPLPATARAPSPPSPG